MAVIGSIRKRSGLLIGVVGVAMAAFILGDFLSGGGGGRPEYHIGEVNGTPIQGEEYDYKVQDQIESLRSVGQPITDQASEQIREQVWGQLIREKVLKPEINDLGLDMTQGEYDDIRWGNNIVPEIRNDQTFINQETGQFDPNIVKQYFQTVQTRFPLYFKMQKEQLIKNRLYTKYNNAVKLGLVSNSVEAKHEYTAINRKVDIRFVQKTYASIPDSTVQVTEEDIRAYYEAHKSDKKYEQDKSRSIEYLAFDVIPTPEDIRESKAWLADLVNDFKNSENDSLFIANNTDSRTYETELYVEGTLADSIDTKIIAAKPGEIVGPYQDGEAFKLVKVINNGQVKEVNARHILLRPNANNTIESLKAKADSLKKVAKRRGNFAELAKEFSEDPGSGAKGGDLGWFGKGAMVPPFDKACFEGRKGDMPIVETQFGIHLIEIMDIRFKDEIKLAVIKRVIEPSKSTYDDVYDIASRFSINNNNEELFFSAADEAGYVVQKAANIEPSAKNIPGLTNARPLIRWMFESELGEVSEPFEIGQKFVVAIVSEINEEGEPSYEALYEVFKAATIREKKADLYKEKMAAGGSIDEIAAAVGAEVKTAEGINFNSYSIPGAGREPKVIGKIVTLNEGNRSVPLEGTSGVYVVEVVAVTEAPEKNDFSVSKSTLENKVKSGVDFGVYNALREQADVKDERYKFY